MRRDPAGEKHRDFPVAVDLSAWRAEAARLWAADGRFTQGSFIESHVASFLRLLDRRADDDPPVLAHGTCTVLDAPETWADQPGTRFASVIRSPQSGFADRGRRHPGSTGVAALTNGASSRAPRRYRPASRRIACVHLELRRWRLAPPGLDPAFHIRG